MRFTNLIISPNMKNTSNQMLKSFSKNGLDINKEIKQEQFNIKDEYGNNLEKSHVKAHERVSKKGKMFQVKEYENKKSFTDRYNKRHKTRFSVKDLYTATDLSEDILKKNNIDYVKRGKDIYIHPLDKKKLKESEKEEYQTYSIVMKNALGKAIGKQVKELKQEEESEEKDLEMINMYKGDIRAYKKCLDLVKEGKIKSAIKKLYSLDTMAGDFVFEQMGEKEFNKFSEKYEIKYEI